MEIIAHRGASYDAPENTLSAINLAWRQNADAVEIDVHISKDGHMIVIHDNNTRRIAGLRRKVAQQTLAQLKSLEVGRWKGRKWAGETISTLEEALVTVPQGKRLFIEIKCGPECLSAFEKALRNSGKKPHQTIAIGFSLQTMELVKRKIPEIEVCWITRFTRNWRSGRWTPKPEV